MRKGVLCREVRRGLPFGGKRPLPRWGGASLALLELLPLNRLENAEVYVNHTRSFRANAEDSRLKDASAGASLEVAVRVEEGKKLGFAYATARNLDALERAVLNAYEEAKKLAKVSREVPWWEGFPSSKCLRLPGTYSEALAQGDISFVIEVVEDVLDIAPKELSVMAVSELKVVEWALANTEGTEHEEKETVAEASVAASKRVNGNLTKSTWDDVISRTQKPDVVSLAVNVFEEAMTLTLRPKRLSGEYVLYLDPRATSELLDFIAEAFYADNVARATSPLSGKLGQKLFSELITLSDNPALPGGPASHGCDEEGVRSSPLTLVEEGTLRAFLGDLYWGYKVGFVGRGYRPSPGAPPAPSYTNLTLHAGRGAEGEVIVAGLTGLHTASVETGDLSVVLSPAWYKGEHVEAVLTANVYELLRDSLEGVDKEGRWVASTFTPGVAVRANLS